MDYSKAVGNSPKYNTFDLSHDKKLSLKMGDVVPVMALDVLPGDKFTIDSSYLTRFLPLVAPVMHNVKLKVRYFFSPNRLVWDDWEDFITGPEIDKLVQDALKASAMAKNEENRNEIYEKTRKNLIDKGVNIDDTAWQRVMSFMSLNPGKNFMEALNAVKEMVSRSYERGKQLMENQ